MYNPVNQYIRLQLERRNRSMINVNNAFLDMIRYEDKEQKKSVRGSGFEEEMEKAEDEKEEMETSKTDTDVIVKPDGSRVLMVTTKVCGMQTTMSLEISKPTAMQNDISEDRDTFKNKGKMLRASAAYESGYMTGIETESSF